MRKKTGTTANLQQWQSTWLNPMSCHRFEKDDDHRLGVSNILQFNKSFLSLMQISSRRKLATLQTKCNIKSFSQNPHLWIDNIPVQRKSLKISAWWFCDFEGGSSVQHAAVIERNYVTGHHFVLYLIGRVSQHSTDGEVTRVQLNGFLWWSKHDGITHVIV